LLITGDGVSTSNDDYVLVKTFDSNSHEIFPEQTWPTADGQFKALVMLSPGHNILEVVSMRNGKLDGSTKVQLQYTPLLQNPPLHLAILVAHDSPLTMDCSIHKSGGVASSHSDLSAAITKLRMTAYMWQAFTAEDMRLKGLGRRTFRLDEAWAPDTVSQDFMNAGSTGQLDDEGAMRSTARVHVVKTSSSREEILNAPQQNPRGRIKVDLHKIFVDALEEHGHQFQPSAHPVVAGLILDSNYSKTKERILGHVEEGKQNRAGISLGAHGSHLTYSWPRFMEEVANCLTDSRAPGARVLTNIERCSQTWNSNPTIWKSCALSQAQFYGAVGEAMGATSGFGLNNVEAFAWDWPRTFLALPEEIPKRGGLRAYNHDVNNATWHLAYALQFQHLHEFRLPDDKPLTRDELAAIPLIDSKYTMNENNEPEVTLCVQSPIGIASICFNEPRLVEETPSAGAPLKLCTYTRADLAARFDPTQQLRLYAWGINGKLGSIDNVWRMLALPTPLQIPNTTVTLYKRTISTTSIEEYEDAENGAHPWAQLLKERGPDGAIHRAVSIDLCVGGRWDGGIVRYADGHVSHWGPMRNRGQEHKFGGHATQTINLPDDAQIVRIEVNKSDYRNLKGVRMHLADGTVRGELNGDEKTNTSISRLEPADHEVVVGFCGKSDSAGMMEFGIVTVNKEVGLEGLPESVFDMDELRNTVEI
jgi:hypothetical protein